MRRRRRQNPLLMKTIAVGVVVTALILPVLAQFGLFKQLQERYVETQLVNLPPPPPQPKEQPPKAKKTVHPHVEAHRGEKMARASHAATTTVHVAATTGKAGNEPMIVNNNNTNIGTVPPPSTGPGTGTSGSTAPPPPTNPVPPPPPPVAVQTTPTEPKQDVIVEAEPTYKPEPVIPDDLLDSDIDMMFYAYFTIHADGSVAVKMVQGTGNAELDTLAMDAVKQWKFAPATKNGVPVDSYRRLQVEFVVS